jgi:uncharacterized protein (DUF302 family)
MDDNGRRIILDVVFDTAVTETLKAFHSEGFDMASTLDVRSYLQHHVHHECRRYLLFNFLLPQVTLEALQHDPELGAVLQTTIAVYELPDGETAVVARPSVAHAMTDWGERVSSPVLAALADRAGERLARALDRLRRAPVGVRRERLT